jgi:bacterioferritin
MLTGHSFSVDVDAIRQRARSHIEQGAVTEAYDGDVETVVALMNDVLATEIVCWLRYKRHAIMAPRIGGIAGEAIVKELVQHAFEEEQHADRVATRIVQLGGKPNYDPDGITKRAHAQYVAGDTLTEMLTEDLVAERIAIDTYSEIIRFLGDHDPTSRRLMEDILAQEEEHADDLADWLHRIVGGHNGHNGHNGQSKKT